MTPVRPPLPNPTAEIPPLFLRDKRLPLGKRTLLVGILNVTPDSFSDGGRYLNPSDALLRLETLLEAGVDLVDVGGESSRPGAEPVSVEEEIRRILPVLEAWKKRKPEAVLSIDTWKAEVAQVALEHGAGLINDITALQGDPRMPEVVSASGAGVVLMHMQGKPRTMQKEPFYHHIIEEILAFFEERIETAQRAGIRRESIILDPGIGFGKTLAHNLEILHHLGTFKRLGRPLLVGPSRKSFIGELLNRPAEDRLFGTAGAVAAAILKGADLVRIHDAAEIKQVVRIVDAIRLGTAEGP